MRACQRAHRHLPLIFRIGQGAAFTDDPGHGVDGHETIIISDDFNARAMQQDDQCEALVAALGDQISAAGMRVTKQNIRVEFGRVRASYRIGEQLFVSKIVPRNVFHIVGRRPDRGHNTTSVHLTR